MTRLVAALAALVLVPVPSQDGGADELARAYQRAFEARDDQALAELWRAHPARVLPTFDADLEASLATWEAAPDAPDQARIDLLAERARWAAGVASRVTGRPIFADYAASFSGWTPDERKRFRAGQEAYGEARKALSEGRAEEALERARASREAALPLGDWWGTAMALSAEGQALAATGRHDEAIVALSQARLFYADLGLDGSRYATSMALCESLVARERWSRARACVADTLALGETLGAAGDRRALLAMRLEAEEGLGLEQAAAATRKELEAAGG